VLYSALETLILFHQDVGSELILKRDEWEEFRKDIADFIKAYPKFFESKEKRRLMYEKLPELNRISFKSAFYNFCSRFNIDLSDLWPVVDRRDGIALADIRNKLIHGDTFNPVQGRALISAREHLSWIVERSLLSVLGWTFTSSKVSKEYLPHMAMYNEWRADRKILSGN